PVDPPAADSDVPARARLVGPPPRSPQGAGGPKPPQPFKMWPEGTGKRQRAEGDEGAEVVLHRPAGDGPLLLVVRFRWEYEFNIVEMGPPERRRTLLRSKRQRRVVVPLLSGEESEVRLAIRTGFAHHWWAWIQTVDTVPLLRDRLGGEGQFVMRHAGGPGRIRMRHTARGAFTLTALTPALEKSGLLLSGRGDTAVEADIEGPTYLHVDAAGPWTVTLL
ncbi:hypothetical protein AB0J52_36455, partial [Spirillospora sp. NPDC049652]